jgi:hypothetical protein
MTQRHQEPSPVGDRQQPFAVAVVLQTIGRSTLSQAVQSVFAQDIGGRIQLLIGVDTWQGDTRLLQEMKEQCPGHVDLVNLDPRCSTSIRHGGHYSNAYGGALRTILTYLANSRYVAYLDDDNWFAANHLSSQVQAVQGKAWAFSRRVLVDAPSNAELCKDTWESMGPGQGVYKPTQGCFVDTSSFLIDKLSCHYAIPAWSEAPFKGGVGEDRTFFAKVKGLPFCDTQLATSYYQVALSGQHPYLLWRFKCSGVELEKFLHPETIPPESTRVECAAANRAQAASVRQGMPGDATKPRMKFY